MSNVKNILEEKSEKIQKKGEDDRVKRTEDESIEVVERAIF